MASDPMKEKLREELHSLAYKQGVVFKNEYLNRDGNVVSSTNTDRRIMEIDESKHDIPNLEIMGNSKGLFRITAKGNLAVAIAAVLIGMIIVAVAAALYFGASFPLD